MPIIGYVLGLVAGLVFFFRGFRIYREYRIVIDTPEVPIRSIAMGLVHIHGTAAGERQIQSGLSGTPCYFYKVDVEVFERDQSGNGSWRLDRTDTSGVPFHLTDATGKVLLDAGGAECDLLQTCRRETYASARYRYTEYCILPDQSYDVTGTCMENPDATNELDRNLIRKGENEPTFLISWRSEKNLESSLRNRAALHIFGGAALALLCVSKLLQLLRML